MVRFHGIFIDLPSVIEGQIVQHTRQDYEVRLVVARQPQPEEFSTVEKRMRSQLGEVSVKITIVGEIPRTFSGKFKSVVSELKSEQYCVS